MDNCCGTGDSSTYRNMLESVVDTKVINLEVLTIAVGILFIVVLLKNKFRSFSGT